MNLYIWAILSTCSSLIFLKYWFPTKIGKIEHRFYWLLLVSLPLSFLVNQFVKKPIGSFLDSFFNTGTDPLNWSVWYLLLMILLAPLTEELIKLLPLFIKNVRNKVFKDSYSAYKIGFLLGISFGIGEIWYLSYTINSNQPNIASMSFLELSGFFGERTIVTIAHGCLTSIVTIHLFNKKIFKGIFLAMSMHYLINLGAGLLKGGLISSEIAMLIIGAAMVILIRLNMKLIDRGF